MDFAVNIPTCVGSSEYSSLAFCDSISWEKQQKFGVDIEGLGFNGLAVPDHLMAGAGPTTEGLATVAGFAGVTKEVTLYSKTFNDQLRHGPLLAKAAAQLDHISGGRLKFGIGAGWKADEAEAFGYEWPAAPERLRRLEETIEVTKRLWSEESVEYNGEFYQLDGADGRPHPVQNPHPPIMVGGGGEQFTLRIAAKHADVWNYWGDLDMLRHKLAVLRDHCESYGTDYDAIQKSWFSRCIIRETEAEVQELLEYVPRFKPENTEDDDYHLIGTPTEIVEDLVRYREAGFEEIVLEFVDFPGTEGADLFAEEVMPEFV
ncbi:LLM class flavin-dependent oxidoreductase [Halegenticoccus tardaugens]|uniref:LLM class flavin-dependent oxidoreductase n=1 Tax=Halegenticoccus tardaugens TaxID=2071624 RepID=UPI00100AA52E|nr:LLM class flavin-dependent oxidoreductase [Halegenticoccus tardaugens]